MCAPGTDAGRDRPLDPNLAKALSHPLRQRILERLSAGNEASPTQLARLLDTPLNNVAYHVRVLLDLGCIELVGTRQRRGALEHSYRAIASPWLDTEQSAQLPAAFRRRTLPRRLRAIVADVSDAGLTGGFDDPEAQISRVSLELDPQGWRDVAALLDRTFASLQRIHADSATRAADHQAGLPTVASEVALLLFRRAPHNLTIDRRPNPPPAPRDELPR